MRDYFVPSKAIATSSGAEDIGATELRPQQPDLTPAEVESRRLESEHRAAEDAAREHRLKLDRVIHSALLRFCSSSYAVASYVNGCGDFGHVASDAEVEPLILEAIAELSPVIRDSHTREDI